MINSYREFIQFIEDGPINGYKVCLESETLGHNNWPAERFVQYIGEIEQYNEADVIYQSEDDGLGYIIRVRVEIHFRADVNCPEQSHTITWVVR